MSNLRNLNDCAADIFVNIKYLRLKKMNKFAINLLCVTITKYSHPEDQSYFHNQLILQSKNNLTHTQKNLP